MVHLDAVFMPAAPIPGRDRYVGHNEIRDWANWATQKRPIMVARTDAFTVLDEDHVLVASRVRTPYSDGGYADRAVVWTVHVVDTKVRSLEARSTIEQAVELHEARTGGAPNGG